MQTSGRAKSPDIESLSCLGFRQFDVHIDEINLADRRLFEQGIQRRRRYLVSLTLKPSRVDIEGEDDATSFELCSTGRKNLTRSPSTSDANIGTNRVLGR